MSVGDSVLDGYKQTASWFDNGVEWLGDVIDFYKERSAIEREAASKLAALTSKHFAKKANITAAVSVGDKPLTTPGSLENMTMQSWMETLNQTEQISAERKQLADAFNVKVTEELAALKSRFEDLSRTYKRFDEALEEHRDKVNTSVKRAKHHYDAACESMESSRAKSRKNAEPKELEMYKSKNQYLIQINIANRIKDKHYHDDLPELLDSLQRTQEARVTQSNRILSLAVDLEKQTLQSITAHLTAGQQAVAGNEPSLDTAMFVEHNANVYTWTGPPDMLFEPSPIWHDNDSMYAGSDEAVRHLGALLGDAQEQNVTLAADSQRAMSTYTNAKKGVQGTDFASVSAAQAAPLLRNEVSSLQKLVESESKRVAAEVEIEAIEVATAGVDMSMVPQTRIKTHRTLFGRKKEVIEVVNKDSVAAGGGNTGKTLGLASLLARTKLGGGGGGGGGGSGSQASIKYSFSAEGPGELSVTAGEVLEIVQLDDGSGWVKLAGPRGTGLVPSSYVDVLFGGMTADSKPAAAPPPPPSRGSQDQKMVAMYPYDAADPSQLSIAVDDVITVVEPDTGSGWTTGMLNGVRGIFPTSYARQA